MHTKLQSVNEVDGCIRNFDSNSYQAFFHFDEKYMRMFDRIRYPVMLKSNISDIYSHKNTNIKINLDDDIPLEK